MRLDLRVSDWPFCTPFGRDGGAACLAEEQDIFLELPGAFPDPSAPPPPHTLLIPRCQGQIVATLRFVCDPRLAQCVDLGLVKFYFGESSQPASQAPNFATVNANETRGAAGQDNPRDGRYDHNLTRSELSGYLNITDLEPGVDYVFWTVWSVGNGSAPEYNSQGFDLSRSQYW